MKGVECCQQQKPAQSAKHSSTMEGQYTDDSRWPARTDREHRRHMRGPPYGLVPVDWRYCMSARPAHLYPLLPLGKSQRPKSAGNGNGSNSKGCVRHAGGSGSCTGIFLVVPRVLAVSAFFLPCGRKTCRVCGVGSSNRCWQLAVSEGVFGGGTKVGSRVIRSRVSETSPNPSSLFHLLPASEGPARTTHLRTCPRQPASADCRPAQSCSLTERGAES